MRFDEFTQVIVSKLGQYLDTKEVTDIKAIEVTSINDTKLVGINVLEKNMNVAPTIYLESYYRDYQSGKDLYSILHDIADVVMEVSERTRDINSRNYSDMLLNFENVRDKIIFRAVGVENNREFLSDKVYDVKNDIALVYFIMITKEKEGIHTCAISNQLFENFGITKEELGLLAMENTPRLFPPVISSMEDVLDEMLLGKSVMKKSFEQSLRDLTLMGPGEIPDMLILSNESNINGASVMFYTDIMEQITERLDNDVYILPSSLHEVILVPKRQDILESELTKMVKEVNATQVASDEVLLDCTYEYCRDVGEIRIANDREKAKEVIMNHSVKKNVRSH